MLVQTSRRFPFLELAARRYGCLLAILLVVAQPPRVTAGESDSAPPSPEAMAWFEAEVRPILVRRCYECHSADADETGGELLLDRREGWRQGGDRGPAVVPGNVEKSLLIQAISYLDPELQMPPEAKLPPREIAILTRWVEDGAPDPRTELTSARPTADEFDVEQRVASHWAWREVVRPSIPQVVSQPWVRDPVDAFILARLAEAGLSPATETDRSTWLRRVTFDLTGLPPTRHEVQRFLQDNGSDAYLRVVDDLLNRPAFGETWAQHWLDLVRYAETKGHEGDFEIPHAWAYRDYVIRAFNQNVPYDDFVREHIAGDLLESPRLDPDTRTNQSIQGTGFWFLGEATHSPVDIRGEESDRVANQIDVFGKTFLGMTIACARCHDHKFDAIDAADYYALWGFLQSSSLQLANVADPAAIDTAQRELAELNRLAADELWACYRPLAADQLQRFPERLLAAAQRARQKLPALPKPLGDNKQGRPPIPRDPVLDLARELSAAQALPQHPLHLFATAALQLDEQTDPAEQIQKLGRGWREQSLRSRLLAENLTVVATRREGELQRIPVQTPFDPQTHVVEDFRRAVGSARP